VLAIGDNIKAGNDSLLAGLLFGCILGVAVVGVLIFSFIAKLRGETGAPKIQEINKDNIAEIERIKLDEIIAGTDVRAEIAVASVKRQQQTAEERKAAEDAAYALAATAIAQREAELELLHKKLEAVQAKAKAKDAKKKEKKQEAAPAATKPSKGGSGESLRDSAEEAPRPRRGGRIPQTELGRGRREEEEADDSEEEDDRRRRFESRRRRPDYE
jgi:hypothetical protein